MIEEDRSSEFCSRVTGSHHLRDEKKSSLARSPSKTSQLKHLTMIWKKLFGIASFALSSNLNQQGARTTEDMALSNASLSPPLQKLVDDSKKLYVEKVAPTAASVSKEAWVTTAPGRVNLIGEHTDYTQGFVFPLAIEYSTVVYGTGSLTVKEDSDAPTSAILQFTSTYNNDKVETVEINVNTEPPSSGGPWIWYVAGTVAQYLKDLPPRGATLKLNFAIAGDVPLGSGLSSSASLEVAVGRFVECALGDYAFKGETDKTASPEKVRAIRCQKAENVWCHSPCGIMVSQG